MKEKPLDRAHGISYLPLLGLADTFGKVLIPEAAGVTVYLVMAAILLWRPEGLFRKV